MRGWSGLWRTSVGLGLRHLARRGYLREAVIRVVVPLDPSRYLELPWVDRELGARPGEHVLDLASPKLLAVALARRGVRVTSVDAYPAEIERWRRLAGAEPNLSLEVADGRALPFPDASFDRAYSVSVLEHIEGDGDAEALRELARVIRLGGVVAVTLPYGPERRDEWRERALYGEGAGPVFFQRWYDRGRVEELVGSVPGLELVDSRPARMSPNWNELYVRHFPKLVPLGPFFGLLAREVESESGDVVRLLFRRRGSARRGDG